MIKAKDIMNADVITVDPEETVEEVMGRMMQHRISGLPVVDMAGQLAGIVTEFGLLELVWEPDTGKNKVYHYMTRDIRTVDEEDELVDIAEMFRISSVRRLLVMRDQRVVGIISRRDLIQHVLQLRQKRPVSSNADC